MSRILTSAFESATQAWTVLRTVAVDLDFTSGHVRVNGSPLPLTIGGNTFTGVGKLGAVSVVEESAELQAYSLKLGLSGIPDDQIATALGEDYQGRDGIVYEVLLDDNHLPIAAPKIVFRGRMDTMDIRYGHLSTVEVTLENRLADWERPRIRRFSAEDLEREYPGDYGLRFASAMENKEVTWPASGWFRR